MDLSKVDKDLVFSQLKVGDALVSDRGFVKVVSVGEDDHGLFVEVEDFYGDNVWSIRKSNLEKYYEYIDKPYSELVDGVDLLMRGELDLSQYESLGNKSTELMSFDKSAYVSYRKDLEQKRLFVKAVSDQMKSVLNSRYSELSKLVNSFQEKIDRVGKIIWTIELYLGIQEDIVQLSKGGPAKDDAVIHLLQDRLYMDEEVGDPTDGGISIENIEDFDNWLLSKSGYHKCFNYELLLPFDKCVRIMRVRRVNKDRDHFSCHYTKFIYDQLDRKTFLLIRNGENVYSIETDMNFGEKLFPDKSEFVDLFDALEDSRWKERDSKKIESKFDLYKRNMIIMQGLIDRTEVFGNVSEINLLSNEVEKNGRVKFFYESNSVRIEGGSQSPLDWYFKASECKEGDRVFYYQDRFVGKDERRDRFYNIYRQSDYGCPDLPGSGVYTLYLDKDLQFDCYYIKTPMKSKNFDYESWDYLPSKKKARFTVYLKDDIVVNFDYISHRDIDKLWHFLHDRRARRDYLRIMPVLIHLRDLKLQEMKDELPFCNLLMSKLDVDLLTARDYVYWWKNKNKWKRDLSVDDEKALRMIVRYHKKMTDGRRVS